MVAFRLLSDPRQLALRSRALWRFLLIALLCIVLGVYWLNRASAPEQPARRVRALQTTDAGAPAPRPKTRTAPPGGKLQVDPTCTAAASQRCVRGDVWSVDSCGNLEEKFDECEAQLCRDGVCESGDERPCTEPLEGRCDQERVRLCYAGRSLSIDCASQGLRCVFGDEGAECVAPIPPAERCTGAPTCNGDVLVQCVNGRALRTDCRTQRASCAQLDDARFPSCVTSLPDPRARARGCGPCGCAGDERQSEHVCDGRDDNLDGLIDEELDCGPVPVVAFVVTDRAGQSSHGPEDVQAELERANLLFAKSALSNPLSFVLEELIWLEDEALLDLDEHDFQQLVRDQRIHPARDHFYLPLVFTDAVSLGGATPKAGVSTLPNGTCGGLQESIGPDVGLVAVAKGRALTTVAHEIGHFLGLCHTHDQRTGVIRTAATTTNASSSAGDLGPSARAEREACQPTCRDEGDGLCDTPFDPGPEQCLYDAMCSTRCLHHDEPDPSNLMSYYTACRQGFSEEQMRLMQHSLALRRAWHPCLENACSCELGEGTCPVGMSCRLLSLGESGSSTRCGLDGPRGPAADCADTRECGQDTLCVAEQRSGVRRCVRPCIASAAGCECTAISDDLSYGLSVCLEDLTVGRR